jgi:protein gp37
MGENSKIEWTTHTFNPWWGCARVSPACENCYAETFATVRQKMTLWGTKAPRRFFGDKHWNEPLKWDRVAKAEGVRARVFCASMADVCEDREDLVVHKRRLASLVDATPNLDWLFLTKRPENFGSTLALMWPARTTWPFNVWLGTTVENQKYADLRIPSIARYGASAVVRFLSMEPLLGPVDLSSYLGVVDWVILGGESGSEARGTTPDWFRKLRDQADAAGIPVNFKQWGEYGPVAGGGLIKLGKKSAGRLLDGRTWDGFPTPRSAA